MTRFIVYAVKLPPKGVPDRPLEEGLYRSWIIVEDAPDVQSAKAAMKRVLSEWPRAELGQYRIGAVPQDVFLRQGQGETFRVDGVESRVPE